MAELFEFLNGKVYVLDGIPGILQHSICRVKSPRIEYRDYLYHVPDSTHPGYLQAKRNLGNDWSTDLTGSIETVCAIAADLGYLDATRCLDCVSQ
ncbi:MAG: hypothetical protein MUC48_21305 [Leptolyngbya sp. Prado105]|jgi:hypothetical protein|nr:hypothetical protein [Leptolyngbya sp. Prado105]